MSVINASGAAIAYEVRGAGSPVMLVAATGYPGRAWPERLCDLLAERHTLITFDYRGTGGTGPTADDYTIGMFAADALAVIRAADGGPVHLIGHSMGGRVAQEAYFTDPAAVASLTLAASGAGPSQAAPYPQVGIPIGLVRAILRDGFEAYHSASLRSSFFTEAFAREHPDEVQRLDAILARHGAPVEEYLKHVRARQAFTSVARLPAADIPVLILIGTADTHRGALGSHVDSAQELRRLLPRARYETIEGQRHGFMWEEPALSAKLLLDFIDAAEH